MYCTQSKGIPAICLDYAILALTLAALVVIFFIMVILESASLQLTRWGEFKFSLKSSLLMNLASTPFGFLVMAQVPRIGLVGVFLAWVLCVLIEWLVLNRLRSGIKRANLRVAMAANLVSYLILILPSFAYTHP